MMNRPSKIADQLSTSQWLRWALMLLLATSFAVRCHRLEAKSLWTDEGLTLRRAEQPLGLVLRNQNLIPVGPNYYDGAEVETVATPDVHPPLYFLFMHAWIRVAGRSEFALRFPSVMASTLALPLLFALGRSLLSKETGLWAVLLAALSPFYTWHAQEARMYAWVVLFGLASVHTFLPLLRDKAERHHYLAYIVATSALLYTHYTGFLLLAFEVLAYTVYQSRRRLLSVAVVLTLLVTILIPLVPFLRRVLSLSLYGFVSRPLSVLVAEAWSYFSLGLSESLIRPLSQTAPFLLLFAVGALMVDVPRRREAWLVSLGHLTLPLLLFHLISYVKPNYMNPRHLLIVSPAWELVMAQGLTTLRRRFWPGLVVLLGLVLFLRGTATQDVFASHRLWKDDIRGAAEYIEERARPGDAVVLHDPVIRLTFDYYYDGPYPEIAIPGYGNDDEQEAINRFQEWSQRYDRIWFLYGPPPAGFPDDLLPGWADDHLFKARQREFEAIWTYVGVAAYDDERPLLDAPPDNAASCGATWGAVQLVGFRAQDAAQGQNGWLELYWRGRDASLREPFKLKVRLLDEQGEAWFEREEEILPFYPPADWPSDRVVRTDFRLPLPHAIPPIRYTVEAAAVGLGEMQPIGDIAVNRSTYSPPTARPDARFGNGIQLLDSELGSDVFRAGHTLFGSLTWRVTAAIENDYRVRARLVNRWGIEAAASDMAASAPGFPTSAWEAGDHVSGHLALPIPMDFKDGPYRVEISLVDGMSGRVLPAHAWYGKRKWLPLGIVEVEAWPLMTELPASVDRRVEEVTIAGTIHLRGYDLAQSDETLELTLYWQAERPIDHNYHVFAHVGDVDQPPVADAGGMPVGWTRPTTTWREGEIITDRHVVSLDGVPPDQYELLIGLYDPETGTRPKTVVEGNVVPGGYVLLQTLDVE